jgi:hypothetical protein
MHYLREAVQVPALALFFYCTKPAPEWPAREILKENA